VGLEGSTGIDAARGVDEADRAGVRIPPPVIYVAGFLVGVALELAAPIGGLPFALALLAGLLGAALWLAFDGSAMWLFHRARTSMVPMKPTTALVTSGPYRITRNPMYVGMAFLYVGLALSLGVIWSLAFLPVVVFAVDRLVIAREERYLEAKFGEEYREYDGHVRRWL
jgi:protein-S-isoprenylcysteine O-methyltransferase Ste14